MDVIGQYELNLQEVVGRHFCSHMDQFIERHIGFFKVAFVSILYNVTDICQNSEEVLLYGSGTSSCTGYLLELIFIFEKMYEGNYFG